MSQVADDLSVGWYQACDLVRSKIPGLAVNQSVWLLPSLESALFEVTQGLFDRNSEMGGSKTKALFVRNQDPAFDVIASAYSASGLDARFCGIEELRDDVKVFDSIKNESLFVALAKNSRFTGEDFDLEPAAEKILALGTKTPLLTVSFKNQINANLKPASWEVNFLVLWSGVTVVIMGDRFRLVPKSAPYQIPLNSLVQISNEVVESIESNGSLASARTVIELFESKLPNPFRPLYSAGALRLLDRAVFSSEAMDGAWVIDKLSTMGYEMIATTSGCWGAEANFKRSDERRHDWLRKNRRILASDLELRGTIQIPYRQLQRDTNGRILAALESLLGSHK